MSLNAFASSPTAEAETLPPSAGEVRFAPGDMRDAALDLLRECALTLYDASRPRSGPKPVADTASLVAREKAWASGETPGLMSIDQCVDAIFGAKRGSAEVMAASQQIKESLIERPAEVLEAIDAARGGILDHFQVHGARALQAEMLSDSMDYIALCISKIQSGRPLDTHDRADLLVELRWLTGRDPGAISAKSCLEAVLGLDADGAQAAQERIAEALPEVFVFVQSESDLAAIPAQMLDGIDPRRFAQMGHLFRRASEDVGSPVDYGDWVAGALKVGEIPSRMRAQ